MKFIHLSDLHLGKRLYGYSLLDDQRFILREILRVTGEEKPDGVLLAGDIYDKTVPPAEAVSLFDDFLTALSGLTPDVYVISGNHDSAERLAFGGRLMERSGVHLAPAYCGEPAVIRWEDRFGPVQVCLLPFLRPAHVRARHPELEIGDYTQAVETAVAEMGLEPGARKVLVAHQFVNGAGRSASEDVPVGGLEGVDWAAFDPFDYVALGHLHRAQQVGRAEVRYAGTPLAYSFEEARTGKSLTVVELREKGETEIRTVPLAPERPLREARGTFREVLDQLGRDASLADSYLRVTLTDDQDVQDAAARLRTRAPHLMRLDYDNARTRMALEEEDLPAARELPPEEVLSQFFQERTGHPLDACQEKISRSLIRKAWGEEA